MENTLWTRVPIDDEFLTPRHTSWLGGSNYSSQDRLIPLDSLQKPLPSIPTEDSNIPADYSTSATFTTASSRKRPLLSYILGSWVASLSGWRVGVLLASSM
ncbi:hypothetical protein K440DRAFT_628307 [Wilcoxina mikolae CBS 423.85]|nr:hypothetical protein K440DRAFT_628307 [Wilcoxina mikolae CBS 423.85]